MTEEAKYRLEQHRYNELPNSISDVNFSGAIVMLLAVISIPALKYTFSFEFPVYAHFVPALIGAGIILLILELIKLFRGNQVK